MIGACVAQIARHVTITPGGQFKGLLGCAKLVKYVGATTIFIERCNPAPHVICASPASMEELHQARTALHLNDHRIQFLYLIVRWIVCPPTPGQPTTTICVPVPKCFQIQPYLSNQFPPCANYSSRAMARCPISWRKKWSSQLICPAWA